MSNTDTCVCGHPYYMHVALSGYPGGCEECQDDDCSCGEFREEQWDGVEGTEEYDE